MKRSKAIGLAAAALAAGLILGSIGIASAAPTTDATTGEPLGYGLRMGVAMRDAGARMVDILADLTCLSVDDIHDRRVEGESVSDIAKSEGVDPATVVDKSLSAREQILDQKVADGTITEATKAEVLERMTARVNERVNSAELGGRGGGMGGGRGAGMGGRGAGAQAGGCGAACVTPAE
ncbi:MAG: hypothetical protein KJ747_01110 [Actinobacteria bacterium]|nr:hypothetical protein [Actinomycetota bacterium]MCG2807716.1 hypothetical protein [Coriobacteriia bacterium]